MIRGNKKQRKRKGKSQQNYEIRCNKIECITVK